MTAFLYLITVLVWGSTWIALKLQLGSVSYVEKEYDDNTMYGLVIWQSVKANTQVDEGSKIYLQVSKKPDA